MYCTTYGKLLYLDLTGNMLDMCGLVGRHLDVYVYTHARSGVYNNNNIGIFIAPLTKIKALNSE